MFGREIERERDSFHSNLTHVPTLCMNYRAELSTKWMLASGRRIQNVFCCQKHLIISYKIAASIHDTSRLVLHDTKKESLPIVALNITFCWSSERERRSCPRSSWRRRWTKFEHFWLQDFKLRKMSKLTILQERRFSFCDRETETHNCCTSWCTEVVEWVANWLVSIVETRDSYI